MGQPDTWVIIDLIQNKLVNLVVWNGDQQIWTVPTGTYAVLLSDINPSDLLLGADTII